MNLRKITAAVLLTITGSLAVSSLISGDYSFAGAGKCAECHSGEAIGNQYGIWQASPHYRTLRLLSSERAAEIADKTGIKDPSTSKACLRCHTTGGGRYENVKNEGVGCEACHGPGSVYHDPDVHVDYSSRKRGYARARQAGMYPILGDAHLKNRERLCLSCHNPERPCIPETRHELLRKKMSIQTVDTLKRGDIDLSHPIRR